MLYVIAGNGTGNATEIQASLKDIRDAAAKADQEFWVLLEGKEEPTKTDEVIYKWLRTNEVWFEAVTSTGIVVDGAQESIGVDDVYAAMMERINERAQESEEGAVLILPVDPEGGTDEDEGLMVFVEAVIDGDVPVFQLNGEMARITLDAEPEAAAAPSKSAAKKVAAPTPAKSVAKKAAAPTKKAAAPAAEPPEDGEQEESVVYTSAELAKMTVPELTAVAKGQGIDVKGLGKKDLISAIEAAIDTGPEPSVAVESTNGDMALVVIHLPGQFVSRMIPVEDAFAIIAK